MKLLIATISLQLMLLGAHAQQQQKPQEAEQLKVELKPVRINSFHIPPWVQSDLHLAPNELKLFAGHALGIIRAKCPLVDHKKLFQLQKYIGKIIATDLTKKSDDSTAKQEGSKSGSELEIVPKTTGRVQFPELLNTLYRCGQEKVEASQSEKNVASSGHSFAVKDPEGVVTLVRAGHRDRGEPTVEDVKAKPNVFLGFQDRDAEFAEAVKKTQPIISKHEQLVLEKDKNVPLIELHSVQKDEKAEEKEAPTTTTTKKPKEKKKAEHQNSFFSWVSSVFSSMQTMFSKIFKDGFGRRRRSIDFLSSDSDAPSGSGSSADSESESQPGSGDAVIGETETDFYASGMSSMNKQEGGGSSSAAKGLKWVEQDKVHGQSAIGALIDETCRLFCGKCNTPQQIRNFRSAGKELMDYIMADENVLIVASHILDEPFLDSIRRCGREIDLTPFATLLSYPEDKYRSNPEAESDSEPEQERPVQK